MRATRNLGGYIPDVELPRQDVPPSRPKDRTFGQKKSSVQERINKWRQKSPENNRISQYVETTSR